jgi:large subunit ribosomal protein L21
VYAIIETGGKQYRVQPGDTIYVERLTSNVGDSISLDQVLLVGGESDVRVGTPLVANATVKGTVLEQGRDRKIRVFKFKRRKHYRRTKGHRQSFTAIRIETISA